MKLARARRSRGSRERHLGQALAEFALVAPWFFLLLLGIVEGGRFIFYYQILNNATREGARYAIVNGASSFSCTGPPAPTATSACDPAGAAVKQRVWDTAFGLGQQVTVVPTWRDPANNGRGSTVTVSASYTYSSLVPLVPLPSITVSAESSLVINN